MRSLAIGATKLDFLPFLLFLNANLCLVVLRAETASVVLIAVLCAVPKLFSTGWALAQMVSGGSAPVAPDLWVPEEVIP